MQIMMDFEGPLDFLQAFPYQYCTSVFGPAEVSNVPGPWVGRITRDDFSSELVALS